MRTRIFTSDYINVYANADGSLLATWNVDGYRGCELTDPNKPMKEGITLLIEKFDKLASRFHSYAEFHARKGRVEKADTFNQAAREFWFNCPISDIITLAMIERYGREHAYRALYNTPAWKVASAFFMD